MKFLRARSRFARDALAVLCLVPLVIILPMMPGDTPVPARNRRMFKTRYPAFFEL